MVLGSELAGHGGPPDEVEGRGGRQMSQGALLKKSPRKDLLESRFLLQVPDGARSTLAWDPWKASVSPTSPTRSVTTVTGRPWPEFDEPG